MRPIVPPDPGSYSYTGTAYANPDAPTSIGNGIATSTGLWITPYYQH